MSGAANVRARFKHRKYYELARTEDKPFSPFVIESYGLMQEEALLLLSKIAAEGEDNCSFLNLRDPCVLSGVEIKQAISVAIQRGNGLAVDQWLRIVRGHFFVQI